MNTPGYESLAGVLRRAYDQAAQGKGAERHANSLPFDKQPMQSISTLLNDHTGLLYQAIKKIQESTRMDKDAAVRELLGAINYCAGAVIFLEKELTKEKEKLDWTIFSEPAVPVEAHETTSVTPVEPPRPPVLAWNTWYCLHGGTRFANGTIVPVGEACPVCFATK